MHLPHDAMLLRVFIGESDRHERAMPLDEAACVDHPVCSVPPLRAEHARLRTWQGECTAWKSGVVIVGRAHASAVVDRQRSTPAALDE